MNLRAMHRISITSTAALFVAGTGHARIITTLSLDRPADMVLTELAESLGNQNLIVRQMSDVVQNRHFQLEWGDPAVKWQSLSTTDYWGMDFEMYTRTGLEVKEKRSKVRWRSAGGEWKEERVNTHGVAVSNVIHADDSIDTIFRGEGHTGAVTTLAFHSKIENGVITYTVWNHGPATHVKWEAVGIDAVIPKNKSESVSIRSVRGAVERHSTASFMWDPLGIAATPVMMPVLHYAKPPRVPAPGAAALMGLGALALGARRRD